MDVVISPYHVTSREPCATAMLLLASRAWTMLPAPLEGGSREDVERASNHAPRYAELMAKWLWCRSLVDLGVLATHCEGDDAARFVREAAIELTGGEGGCGARPLNGLIRREDFLDPRAWLGAISNDMLRGGPDPGVSVPVAAGLDRFALEHGLFVTRADPVSVVQKAEAKMAGTIANIMTPVFTHADADLIAQARDDLSMELTDVRECVDDVCSAYEAANTRDESGGGEAGRRLEDARLFLREAAAAYGRAFEVFRNDLKLDKDREHPIASYVGLTVARLPADAVQRSTAQAIHAQDIGDFAPHDPKSEDSADLHESAGEPRAGDLFTIFVRRVGRQGASR